MQPTISVIIPSYEHAAFVGRAIESVLTQSCADLELLITDDGSRDESVEIIRQFTDPRLSLEVFPHNLGASVAINSALARARGEFVCFLGSDDAFLPGKLEVQLSFMRANPQVAALFGLPEFIGENHEPIRPVGSRPWYDAFKAPIEEQLHSRQDWLRHFFLKGNCLCQPTSMIRRRVLGDIGTYDHRLANVPDFDLWVRICMRYDIHVMDHQMTAVRILSDDRNMSAPRPDTRRRSTIEFLHVLKHYRPLSLEFVRQIFASEISARGDLVSEPDQRILLAELALMVPHPSHQLFGLDTMFDAMATQGSHSQRLIRLAGLLDPFGLNARQDSALLHDQLASAQAEIDRLTRELAAAQDQAREELRSNPS